MKINARKSLMTDTGESVQRAEDHISLKEKEWIAYNHDQMHPSDPGADKRDE